MWQIRSAMESSKLTEDLPQTLRHRDLQLWMTGRKHLPLTKFYLNHLDGRYIRILSTSHHLFMILDAPSVCVSAKTGIIIHPSIYPFYFSSRGLGFVSPLETTQSWHGFYKLKVSTNCRAVSNLLYNICWIWQHPKFSLYKGWMAYMLYMGIRFSSMTLSFTSSGHIFFMAKTIVPNNWWSSRFCFSLLIVMYGILLWLTTIWSLEFWPPWQSTIKGHEFSLVSNWYE